LGAKFKTRLVTYFISLSLLPVIFLFFVTHSIINRSVEKWFREPADQMVVKAREIVDVYARVERQRAERAAITLARLLNRTPDEEIASTLSAEFENQGLFIAQFYDTGGRLVAERSQSRFDSLPEGFRAEWQRARAEAAGGRNFGVLIDEDAGKKMSLICAAPVPGRGGVVIAQQVPPELFERVNAINRFEGEYNALKGEQKWVKNTALITLALITLLVIFIAFWLAVYVARSIADPVQQLAQATERIKSGDLGYRAGVIGDDELAALALS